MAAAEGASTPSKTATAASRNGSPATLGSSTPAPPSARRITDCRVAADCPGRFASAHLPLRFSCARPAPAPLLLNRQREAPEAVGHLAVPAVDDEKVGLPRGDGKGEGLRHTRSRRVCEAHTLRRTAGGLEEQQRRVEGRLG